MRDKAESSKTQIKPWKETIFIDTEKSIPEALSENVPISELSEIYLSRSALQNELLRLGLGDLQQFEKSVEFNLPYTDNSHLRVARTENKDLFKVIAFKYSYFSFIYPPNCKFPVSSIYYIDLR